MAHPKTRENGAAAAAPPTAGPPIVRGAPRWQQTFEALRYPNYRLWFMGQLVSLVGTWMQMTAQGFLVYQLTGSTAYLGYVGFAMGAPSWLFTLWGGVIADRIPRRNLMLVAQAFMMVLAFTLAALTFTGRVQPWHIVVLAFLLGTANAFDAPARQAFVLELVDREALTNAIALNSSMFTLATVVGPAVAGITYAAFGPAWCFTLNGVSFIAIIIALALMRLEPRARRAQPKSGFDELKEGLRYTASQPVLRTLILVPGVASMFVMAFATLLPAWAVAILGGDATTNGLLQSARGLGSLSGALMMAVLGNFRAKGRLLTLGAFAGPVFLMLFSAARWLPLSLFLLVGVGWGMMITINMANTLVQSVVPDDLRGRVMSIYVLIFFGGMPLGALWAGTLAQLIGPPLTVLTGGIVALAVAIAFWIFVPQLRRLELGGLDAAPPGSR